MKNVFTNVFEPSKAVFGLVNEDCSLYNKSMSNNNTNHKFQNHDDGLSQCQSEFDADELGSLDSESENDDEQDLN